MFIILVQKQRCIALEEQLIEIILTSLEDCAAADVLASQQTGTDVSQPSPCPCTQISSLLIYLFLYQLISFQSMVQTLLDKVSSLPFKKYIYFS